MPSSLHVCSAGVTDSALTVHGSLQAERLAKYLGESGVRFTHIFSSDLQRAYKTAITIYLEQSSRGDKEHPALEVIALAVLREQDFGSYEGKPFSTRPHYSKECGKGVRRAQRPEGADFKAIESKESLTARTGKFLEEHLVPILQKEAQNHESAVAIVSHGILLSHLWRSLLQLLPKDSVALSPGLPIRNGGLTPLEHLGGWSNTGFLELVVQNAGSTSTEQRLSPSPNPTVPSNAFNSELLKPHVPPISIANLKAIVKTVNGKDHLIGLKRTRGGVGSSKHDEDQKTIESFFKKRKV